MEFDEDNWKSILGDDHVFVKIAKAIPTKVEALDDYVMITVKADDLTSMNESRLTENKSFQKPSEDSDIESLKKRYYGIAPEDLEMIASKQDPKVFYIGSPEFDASAVQLGDYIQFPMDSKPTLVFQSDEKSVNAAYDNAEYSQFNRSLLSKLNRKELAKK
jgi:hypothetical protein